MSSGPYLYDDGPESRHTGTPRPRRGLLLALLAGTVAVAVGMAIALPLLRGTPEEQAREVTGVFLAALAADDVATAHELLCEEERTRLRPAQVPGAYARPGEGEVVGTAAAEADGARVQRVEVRWTDGGTTATSTVTVVSENGPRVCGTASRN